MPIQQSIIGSPSEQLGSNLSLSHLFLHLSILLALTLTTVGCQRSEEGAEVPPEAAPNEDATLRFRSDGSFRIVQFTDTQDDQDIDPRTVRLMEAVLEDQAPDLVVFSGDNVRSGPQTPEDVRTAIRHIALSVDSRGIPWVITFGNHDEDHTSATGMDKEALLEEYMSYAHNINRVGPAGVTGTGNMQTTVLSSTGDEAVFSLWFLDSGMYSPDSVGGQATSDDELGGWDVIRHNQVAWYYETSLALEEEHGAPIPGLAFFHIPLPEFHLMWECRENHGVVGELNEPVSSGPFNSGLFAAMQERGDVKGVFVGHDHINDFEGDYFGIRLGYAANTGFGTYGLDGDEENRMRGARVFVLTERDPANFESYMVWARDYGIQ